MGSPALLVPPPGGGASLERRRRPQLLDHLPPAHQESDVGLHCGGAGGGRAVIMRRHSSGSTGTAAIGKGMVRRPGHC